MFLNKQKFAVSCAIAATVFAGCQTAQKTSGPLTDADLIIPDAYVSNDGAYRDLASGPGELWEKATTRLAKFGDRGEAEIQRILKALNENKAHDVEIDAFKKKYGKITKENAGQLDNDIHARVLDELMSKSKNMIAMMKGAEQSAKDLRDLQYLVKTDLQKAAKGSLDTRVVEKGNFKGTFKAAGSDAKVNGGFQSASGKVHLEETYNKAYLVRMKEQVLADPAVVVLKTKEGEAVFDDFLRAAKEAHMASGEAMINKDMCMLEDLEAMKKVTKLLDEKTEAAKAYGKAEQLTKDGKAVLDEKGRPITVYKLCPEAAAVITANFQQELGRLGIAAWTAGQETCGPCKLCGPKGELEAEASRKLASTSHGEVPKVPEKCK